MRVHRRSFVLFFFFNDTATTEIYTLSLHDALPIYSGSTKSTSTLSATRSRRSTALSDATGAATMTAAASRFFAERTAASVRSEEHTSELQSQSNLVCRLLLEKKKQDGGRHNPGSTQ